MLQMRDFHNKKPLYIMKDIKINNTEIIKL